MSKIKDSVIVTSAKSRVAYNIVRSLGRHGCNVCVSDVERCSMSAASRYASGSFLYPSPFTEPENFINCLINNIKQRNVDVLIPVLEETFLFSKYKNEIEKNVKIVIPEYEQILTVHNKDKWVPIATQLGILSPKSYLVSDIKKDMSLLRDIRYPALLKPKQGGGGWAILELNSVLEAKNILLSDTYSDHLLDHFFIQEKIIGGTHCVAMLFCQGSLRGKVAYQQLRQYPVKFGQAVLRESIRSEIAEEHLESLLIYLNWHGVCQADFVVEESTGIPYLVDINPRFWGSLAQSIASNVDFPWLLYRIAMDGDVDPVNHFKIGARSRWFGGDLCSFFPLLSQSLNKTEFVKNFVFQNFRDVFWDDLSTEDLLPFFAWGFYSFRSIFSHKFLNTAKDNRLNGIWK